MTIQVKNDYPTRSMATETIELVDNLVKAKIPKKTATQLVDFVEKHQSQEFKNNIDKLSNEVEKVKNDTQWLKWAIGFVIGLIFFIGSITVYLHSNISVRLDKIETKMNNKLDKLETKLDRLLNK